MDFQYSNIDFNLIASVWNYLFNWFFVLLVIVGGYKFISWVFRKGFGL